MTMIGKCPDANCDGKLFQADAVLECDTCRSRWFIIKTSDGAKRRELPSKHVDIIGKPIGLPN